MPSECAVVLASYEADLAAVDTGSRLTAARSDVSAMWPVQPAPPRAERLSSRRAALVLDGVTRDHNFGDRPARGARRQRGWLAQQERHLRDA